MTSSSALTCFVVGFYAPSLRGIPAVFHSPQASESLSLAWPRESNQREGHPTLTPCAQSLCSRYAGLLRGSPTVHPWTGVELAHFLWATLRALPPQSRRDRGAPYSAHRARQSNSEEPEAKPKPKRKRARNCFVFAAHDALSQGPLSGGEVTEESPQGGSQGCEPVWRQSTDGLSTNPGVTSRTRRAGARRASLWGGLLFGYSSLGHARESDSLA